MQQGVPPPQIGLPTSAPDEAPSQALLPIANQAVLLLCRPSPALDELCRRLIVEAMRPKVVPDVALAPPFDLAPRYSFIDWSLPGAAEYLSGLSLSSCELSPVVLVDSAREAALAYESGAVATASRPIVVEEVVAYLRSQRQRTERRRINDVAVEHDQRVCAATTFEAMLRTLGHELRTPLATALANMEYLGEVTQSPNSPMSDQEQLAVVTDSLEAMRQLRATLENMSVLLPREPLALQQVRLWSVAQRVIDELPSGAPSIELQGDGQVRAWGDEAILVEVTSVLIRRAMRRLSTRPSIQCISVHIYAHDTEARLTVREPPSHPARRRTTDDPFAPIRTNNSDAQVGLKLAAARHAIVTMGGMLSYLARKDSSSAFRIRLRLA